MFDIQFSKISKWCVIIFLFYVFWFQYSYRENRIILYGTIGTATLFMILDFLLSDNRTLSEIPWGVGVNLVMSVYSLLTGIFVAVNQSVLISAVKTYFCFSIMIFIICYVSREEKGIDWIIKTIIWVCLVSAGYVIFRGYQLEDYGYVLSADNNPNTLGVLMDIGIFCTLFRLKER